jgi:hypothetical protein
LLRIGERGSGKRSIGAQGTIDLIFLYRNYNVAPNQTARLTLAQDNALVPKEVTLEDNTSYQLELVLDCGLDIFTRAIVRFETGDYDRLHFDLEGQVATRQRH